MTTQSLGAAAADAIQAIVGKRAEQARTADRRNAVGVIAELGERVQHALWHRPAEWESAVKLGPHAVLKFLGLPKRHSNS
jgi:hypothetical protein